MVSILPVTYLVRYEEKLKVVLQFVQHGTEVHIRLMPQVAALANNYAAVEQLTLEIADTDLYKYI